MDLVGEKLVDTRLIDRNIAKGLISREAYEKQLAELPDAAEQAEVIEAKFAEVGVKAVEAKDTGEHE